MTVGNAYLTRMPVGFVGMVNRQDQALLQPELLDPTNGPTAYGVPVKMVSGKILALAAGATAASIVGFLAKPYPVQETSTPGGTLGGPSAPNLALPADIMKRGYMIVKMGTGTAVKGGQVYVCATTSAPDTVGDIGDSTIANAVAIANCFFMGAADASGVVEISYNIER